jgi:uncharacterized protein
MINNENRYNKFSDFLKLKFNEKVHKICIDGGFTCPNRDGKCGKNGCIYCSEKGSGENTTNGTISNQVNNYLNSYKGSRANKYIIYFQNFTNTYDTLENLKKKYDSALISNKIVGLSIATRPDCIDENIAKLISTYKSHYFTYVELGLQTSNDKTAQFINRCYKSEVFTKAVEVLNKYDIPVVVHIMIGLPNETQEDLENTIAFLNKHKLWGIKIHSTYIVKNTALEQLYNDKKYIPLTLDEYIEKACFVLTHINKDMIIHKISGDAPKDLLVAPLWNSHKKWIINGITKYLETNNLYQGIYYKN